MRRIRRALPALLLATTLLSTGIAGAPRASRAQALAATWVRDPGHLSTGAVAPPSAELAFAVQGNVYILLPDSSTRQLTHGVNAALRESRSRHSPRKSAMATAKNGSCT